MKKIIALFIAVICLGLLSYFAFIYYISVSEGIRSGELIRLSHKGVIIKTWEGELSQGISGAQIFKFSVLDDDKEVIEKLKAYQGQYVKLTYEEKYRTFFWWGETRFFIKTIQKEKSPFNQK
ncbi:6-phosphogluconate dehydrogenase [Flavobacterium aestuarii]|uniref:6-phosphogluconate dehydrogenase n=1 Tax=Flavobacterium aestuarii TaxID=3149227 RepID=UPI0032B30F81